MVALGSAATIYTVRNGTASVFPISLGYFTIMEGLQAIGYLVVDNCADSANQVITLLSFFHIAFQPFFINALAMHFIPTQVSARIYLPIYCICAISTAVMLLQLYPLDIFDQCRIGQPLCGESLCLRSGSWHIAWDIPYNGLLIPIDDAFRLNSGFPSYVIAGFLVPLCYGAWRFVAFHLLAGPVMANLITANPNEAPAIWCLFSVAIISLAVIPQLRQILYGKSWFLWPASR